MEFFQLFGFSSCANMMLCLGQSTTALLTACSLILPSQSHKCSWNYSAMQHLWNQVTLWVSHPGCFSQSKLQASTFQLLTLVHRELGMSYNLFTEFLSLSHLCPICLEAAELQFLWCNLGQTPPAVGRVCTTSFPGSCRHWCGWRTGTACSGNESRDWEELGKQGPARLSTCAALWLAKGLLKISVYWLDAWVFFLWRAGPGFGN